jgi:hypothetical protein
MAPVLLFMACATVVVRKNPVWSRPGSVLQEAPDSLLRPSDPVISEGLSLAHSPGPAPLPLLDQGAAGPLCVGRV